MIPRTVLPRRPLPALIWRSLLYRLPGGEVIEFDVLWILSRWWPRFEQTMAPQWHRIRVGPFTLAVRLTV